MSQKKVSKVLTPTMIMRISVLFLPLFVIACSDNNMQSKETDGIDRSPLDLSGSYDLPPAYTPRGQRPITPPRQLEPETVTLEEEGDPYSPGGIQWHVPSEEDLAEWDRKQYIDEMHQWAAQRLNRWTCNTCGQKLSKKFFFVSRDFDRHTALFKCECTCGHVHEVTLSTKSNR